MTNMPIFSPRELNGVDWLVIIPYSLGGGKTENPYEVHIGLYYDAHGVKQSTYLTLPEEWDRKFYYTKGGTP